tara:strand:+ start:89 stop:514 length:426 start_codon:yes stop_codon:yes gene_type:complete
MKIKKNLIFYIILFLEQIFCQNSLLITKNSWLFESMTTITKGKREKISILYQDEKNFETLTFIKPNVLEYYIVNDGLEHNGLAKWTLNGKNLTIISDKDTIKSVIEIERNMLNIITYDIEPGTNYGFTTIIKYKNKIKNID